jgi:hypothetical protein
VNLRSPLFADMFAEPRTRGFEGDFSATYAERVVQATDNAIYQVLPQAVAFPRSTEDLVRIARLTCDPRFAEMTLAARQGTIVVRSAGHARRRARSAAQCLLFVLVIPKPPVRNREEFRTPGGVRNSSR